MAAPLLTIQLDPGPFQPLLAMEQWQAQVRERLGRLPAAESSFVGRVRPHTSAGQPLAALELEHYPGMTETQLQRLATAAASAPEVAAVLVRHRIGRVLPGDPIVLVAVAADRRGPAQRCCQELLEALKHEAPFWKREWLADGSGHWLGGNTPL
jgi:molybdopterin synthase catalytic subunit